MTETPLTVHGHHAALYYGFAFGALTGGYAMQEGGWWPTIGTAVVALLLMAYKFWRVVRLTR